MELLKLTNPMMKGQAVQRLQELGDSLGFNYGDNDGVFGPDTDKMVRALQTHLKIESDGVCGSQTWDAIHKAIADKDTERERQSTESGGLIVDRRGLHKSPKYYAYQRPWSKIKGVTLHQTGCRMSDNPANWDSLNAHIGITQDGKIVLVNDPADMIWHAQKLSEFTIGIEICGNYYGIDGVENTLWKGGGGPHHLNAKMLIAFDRLFDWLSAEFKKNEQPWTRVHAHRQSSDQRVSDPGSEIWQAVGIKWLEKLGASDGGAEFKLGNGKPVPKEWNPAYASNKF